MIIRVAFVSQPTRDLARAQHFYGDLLGLAEDGQYDGSTEFITPDGVIVAAETHTPKEVEHPIPYLALETDDLDAEVQRLQDAGVTVAKEPWTNHDADGGVVCHMAVVLDPDGNPIMLHQTPPDRREP